MIIINYYYFYFNFPNNIINIVILINFLILLFML